MREQCFNCKFYNPINKRKGYCTNWVIYSITSQTRVKRNQGCFEFIFLGETSFGESKINQGGNNE